MVKPIPPADVPLTSPPALTQADWYDWFRALATAVVTGPIRTISPLVTLTYGPTVQTNAADGVSFFLTVTNGSNFTMAAPTNGVAGQTIRYTIRNASGGGMGTVTWDSVFKVPNVPPSWSPANGFSRSLEFVYDGTNWVLRYGSTDDVPN